MAVYAVTGKLGSGKSLYAVYKIQQYLFDKRRVACNFDLDIGKLLNPRNKNSNVCRLPDLPTAADIRALGRGDGRPANSNFYDESKFGVIVLDEAALWLNSHDYKQQGRRELFDLFILIRKMCWDVYILIQSVDVLDSQLRKSVCEHVVYLSRLDRIPVPFASYFTLGLWSGRFPKLHLAVIRYGIGASALRVGTEQFRGTKLYGAYNTLQKFEGLDDFGTYSLVPPGRFPRRVPASPFNLAFVMRSTKIYWKRLNRILCVLVGAALAALVFNFYRPAAPVELAVDSVTHVAKNPSVVEVDEYRNYRIISSRNFNDNWLYILSNGSKQISSDDLISLGFSIYPLGAEQMKLQFGNSSFFVFR